MRSELYYAIRDKAKEMTPDCFVDIQKGQFKKIAENYPLPLPALLVEFKSARYSNLEALSQLGELNVSLYYYIELVSDSFEGSELEDDTISLLDNMELIYQNFHGLRTSNYTALIRVGENIDQYGTRFICFRTDFTTSRKDSINKPQTVKINPTVKINI